MASEEWFVFEWLEKKKKKEKEKEINSQIDFDRLQPRN